MFLSEFAKLLTRCRFPDPAVVSIKFKTADGVELVVQNVQAEIGEKPCITVVLASMGDVQLSDGTRFLLPGYRVVANKPGERIQISHLIDTMTAIREQFGDTCVYARDVCWGAVALNREADDEGVTAPDALVSLVTAAFDAGVKHESGGNLDCGEAYERALCEALDAARSQVQGKANG